jgi:hypothetical protein
MMSAHPPFVKSGQAGVVDQARGEPAGERAGAAIGHQGHRKPVTAIMARFIGTFSKFWAMNQQATPIAILTWRA